MSWSYIVKPQCSTLSTPNMTPPRTVRARPVLSHALLSSTSISVVPFSSNLFFLSSSCGVATDTGISLPFFFPSLFIFLLGISHSDEDVFFLFMLFADAATKCSCRPCFLRHFCRHGCMRLISVHLLSSTIFNCLTRHQKKCRTDPSSVGLHPFNPSSVELTLQV